MTDAPRASGAVWPRPLRRSPPEQAQATGKWRDNIGAVDRWPVNQSEQPETRIFPARSRHHWLARAVIQGPLVAAILFAMVGMDARQVTERQEPPKVGEILIVIGRPRS